MSLLKLEVAYATPERQVIIPLEVEYGTNIASAIENSGIQQDFPEIDLNIMPVGVFSQKKSLKDLVATGDRVDIYRPLIIEPMQKRRLLAEKSK